MQGPAVRKFSASVASVIHGSGRRDPGQDYGGARLTSDDGDAYVTRTDRNRARRRRPRGGGRSGTVALVPLYTPLGVVEVLLAPLVFGAGVAGAGRSSRARTSGARPPSSTARRSPTRRTWRPAAATGSPAAATSSTPARRASSAASASTRSPSRRSNPSAGSPSESASGRSRSRGRSARASRAS
jgi:hypothetical protein